MIRRACCLLRLVHYVPETSNKLRSMRFGLIVADLYDQTNNLWRRGTEYFRTADVACCSSGMLGRRQHPRWLRLRR